jgi:hypothetical protein
MTLAELEQEYKAMTQDYQAFCALGLELNMARGKPSAQQLDLSMGLLQVLPQALAAADAKSLETCAPPTAAGGLGEAGTVGSPVQEPATAGQDLLHAGAQDDLRN